MAWTVRDLRLATVLAFGLVAAAAVAGGCGGTGDGVDRQAAGDPAAGRRAYDAACAACHGPNLAGSNRGPSFLDRVYEPSHHGDASFLLAVRNGARAHHWGFGDMPPIPGVTDADVANIVAYVRSEQRARGLR